MFNRSQVIPEAISISIIPIIPIPQLSSVLRVEVLSRSLWGASQQAAAHGCARPQTQRLHNVSWAADAAIGQDGNAIDAPEKSLRPQLPTKEGPSWEVATEPPWALSRGLLKPYCLEGCGGKDAWNRLHDHWSNVKHDFIVILLTQKPKAYCWCQSMEWRDLQTWQRIKPLESPWVAEVYDPIHMVWKGLTHPLSKSHIPIMVDLFLTVITGKHIPHQIYRKPIFEWPIPKSCTFCLVKSNIRAGVHWWFAFVICYSVKSACIFLILYVYKNWSFCFCVCRTVYKKWWKPRKTKHPFRTKWWCHCYLKRQLLYFEWSPPWHLFVMVSDISSGNVYGIIFWHSILAFYLAFYLTFFSGILPGIFSDILSGILCNIYTDFSLAFWFYLASFLPYVLAYVLGCYLAFYLTFFSGILSGISSGILCGWGLAGNTLIRSSQLRSGGEHSDPELAVEAQRRTLWSRGCDWGPAGRNTAI